jgi:23S rRNA pseudouridine2605 synthase
MVMEQHGERLQKVLARGGVGSRRHAEELIAAGRVRVNGRVVTELGTRVDPRNDKVELDGRRLVMEAPVYFLFHKPRGSVTTMVDPEGRATIADSFKDLGTRVFPVGRLDFQTSGALLVTNDGALANALTHPSHHVAKVYVAKVRGVVTDLQLEPWREGMMLPPTESDPDERQVPTAPALVKVLRVTPPDNDETAGSTWLEVTLREGRTRQIHRMAEATGLFVMRLARISFAGLSTAKLRPGERRALNDKEITLLKKAAGLAPDEPIGPKTRAAPETPKDRSKRPPLHRRAQLEREAAVGTRSGGGEPSRDRSAAPPPSRRGAGRARAPGSREEVPVQERPSSREGAPAKGRRPSREGAPAKERPSSREGKPARERPSSREGKPTKERPSSREGKPATGRPPAREGKGRTPSVKRDSPGAPGPKRGR